MKKILLVFAIVMAMIIGVNAQSDGFFRGGDYDDGSRSGTGLSSVTPMLPGGGVAHYDTDQPAAPLGSGLLILSALGGAYLLRKKK